MGRRNSQRTMPADAVRSRADLEEYLSQSLLIEYHERVAGRITRQVATSLKSYLVEQHFGADPRDGLVESGPFSSVEATGEATLWLAKDRRGVPYFVDTLDPRFSLVHTIGHTNSTDATLSKLQGSPSADRCWFPTSFLLGQQLGRLIGFRFFHQRATDGLADSDESRRLAKDLGRTAPPPFRLTVTEYANAEEDLRAFMFGMPGLRRRAAVESLSWRTASGDSEQFIHDHVWSDGKVVAYGNSWSDHLENVYTLQRRYRDLVLRLEDAYAIRWNETGLGGQPIEVDWAEAPIHDLGGLTSALASGRWPYRIAGVAQQVGDSAFTVHGVDLHTRDRITLELNRRRLLVFLHDESCGNVLLRLLVHIEQHLSSAAPVSVDLSAVS